MRHFSIYFDQKLKIFTYLDFIPFFSPKRVYHEEDMSFDQKMDFSWPMPILGLFQNLAVLGNISKKFGNIFLYVKNRHIYRILGKKLQN